MHGNVYGVTIDNNIIKNCIAEEKNDRPSDDNFAIRAFGTNQIISNNLILYSISGIYGEGIIKNNVIKYSKHTAICAKPNNQILDNIIIGTNLTKNTGAWWGHCAIYLYYTENAIVDNNYFEGTNDSKARYHCAYCENTSNIVFNNNIYKDYDKIVEGGSAIITNNKESIYLAGDTSNRPLHLGTNIKDIGKTYFDTTLNKPIYWNGTKWVDAIGADV